MATRRTLAILMAICTSGCAQGLGPTAVHEPVCDVASGSATMFQRAAAVTHAHRSLDAAMDEVRGDILQAGGRRIRAEPASIACEPYALLGPSSTMWHCTARARLCSR